MKVWKELKNKVAYNTLLGALIEAILVFICIASTGVIIASTSQIVITPKWVANGWPSFYGYPKNIENGAITLILLSIPVVSFLFYRFRSRLLQFSFAMVAAITAGIILKDKVDIAWTTGFYYSINSIALASLVYYSVNHTVNRTAETTDRLPTGVIVPLTFLISIMAAVLVIEYPLFVSEIIGSNPRLIDTHHNGEVFAGALDLLNGGKPFVTYFWPHGLEDIGVAALAFKLSSSADLPTMLLAEASRMILGCFAVFILATGLGLGPFAILTLFTIVYFNPAIIYYSYLLTFVPLSFLLFSKARRFHHFAIAGVCMFVAHIYRIEVGVYGFASVSVILIYRIISATASHREDLQKNIFSLAAFVAGFIAAAMTAYVLFGWPGAEWYRTVFSILPKYHADSTGKPFPIPIVDSLSSQYYQFEKGFSRYGFVVFSLYAIFLVMTVFCMFAAAWKYVFKNAGKETAENIFTLLLILYAVFSLKSVFGRSDASHIQWAGNSVYLIAALLVARLLVSITFNKWLRIVVLCGLFAFFNTSTGLFNNNPLQLLSALRYADMSFIKEYAEKKPEQCSNVLQSRIQMSINPYYDWYVCYTRKVLETYRIGKRQLLIVHSAPLLYYSLGYTLPTKYYQLGWAITEGMQKELILELEKSEVSAVLYVDPEYGAMRQYDIPDAIRMPVFHKWLTENFDFSRTVKTPFGEVLLKKGYKSEFKSPHSKAL